jgi:hypothetical protein
MGRLVALIYLVCILAPGSALAFGDARLNEHCLFGDLPIAAVAHHEGSAGHTAHSATGHHDHGGQSAGVTHHHEHDDRMAASTNQMPSDSTSHQHQTMDPQCCGMLCVAALPASISDVVTPCPAHTVSLPDVGGHLADNLPLRHYRPPII